MIRLIISCQVAAAFLLFPSTVEVDVNGVKRKRSVRSLQDNRLDMAAGLCADSESSICKLLSTILISKVISLLVKLNFKLICMCGKHFRGKNLLHLHSLIYFLVNL